VIVESLRKSDHAVEEALRKTKTKCRTLEEIGIPEP